MCLLHPSLSEPLFENMPIADAISESIHACRHFSTLIEALGQPQAEPGWVNHGMGGEEEAYRPPTRREAMGSSTGKTGLPKGDVSSGTSEAPNTSS